MLIVLCLSVSGKKVHEGEEFLAVIKLINRSFKECTILIDDSIQRHTMKIDSSLDEKSLYDLAVEEGDNWLERNINFYSQLKIPYKIMRWDDWSTHQNYNASHRRIVDFYQKNDSYQAAVNKNIEEFLERYQAHHENFQFDYEKAFSYCWEYLMEECAVMCLWAEAGYAFEVYPTSRNKAMTATYELLIKPSHP